MQKHLKGVDREHFVILLLNIKLQVIRINTAHIGLLNSSVVHPRFYYCKDLQICLSG
ncbi:JAB domain-containing protein [Thermoflavimicrobium daqui]|uniref:JAB domain-containing protein n=1 Tax=Thermoflavimicrobium daqui TaxID=2137476 RepID=UPI003B836F2B